MKITRRIIKSGSGRDEKETIEFVIQGAERKQPQQVFRVDRSFETRSRVTPRTVAVSEAFGIGIDNSKRFTIFKDFVIEINPGQVVLITGDSGSGKSTLLREVCAQVAKGAECRLDSKSQKEEFGSIVSNESINIPEDETLIEGVGKDATGAISILSMAGLNEAFLMIRKYGELSDGQKYRYRVAKMIDSDAGVWAFDEFAAVLDRVTAKVVSYTVQKTARKLGRTLIIATTHEDLLEDLKPDIWVKKNFGEGVVVKRFDKDSFPSNCTLLKDVKVSRCQTKDIEELEQFHYRGKNGGIVRHCFRATLNDELVAGIVYVFPHTALKGRSTALPEFSGKVTTERMNKVNREIIRIARVIVAPKYRSIGLGAHIVRETMPLVRMKYVETLAVMARYNCFFESAGMKRVDLPESKALDRELSKLEALGFRREFLPSKSYNLGVLQSLNKEDLEEASRFALRNCIGNKFRKVRLVPLVKALDKDAIAEALQNVRSNALYLYWRNPSIS